MSACLPQTLIDQFGWDHFIRLSAEYRAVNRLPNFGYVVFFAGIPCGWMREPNAPQNWIPGCMAIDRKRDVVVSLGGDQDRGAEAWIPAGLSLERLQVIIDGLYELEGTCPKERLEEVGRELEFFERLQREMKEAAAAS